MSNAIATPRAKNALVEIRDQLQAREAEFAAALPSHVRPEHFQRATLTAIQQNSKLLEVDRRSLLNELMRCAADGLVPDGREAALVIFKDRERGSIAKYMQMVQGVRKLVQQGGQISRFEQTVVCENDKFNYQLGDNPQIHHAPALKDRGDPVLVYSVAQFNDGTLSREVMTVEEIEKVRNVSRSKDSGPWTEWWGEMARKTVARRHAKVLPTSNDAMAALARDDEEHFAFPVPGQRSAASAPGTGRPRLSQQLDALSHSPGVEPQRGRGRPRRSSSKETDSPPAEPPLSDDERVGDLDEGDGPDMVPDVVPDGANGPQLDLQSEAADDDGWPGPRADFDQGVKDARAGRAGCLNREIRENPARLAEWQKGFNSKQAHA